MNGAWNLHPHLDRLAELRPDEGALQRLWEAPGTRVLTVGDGGTVARRPGEPLGEPVAGLAGPLGRHDDQRDVLLGSTGGVAWFCRRGPVVDGSTLRDPGLDGAEVELVAAATAVLAWHDAARFCERCGQATVMARGGFQRHCTGCDRELFPRTDPAMIVAVLDDADRLLLAHQASWPQGRVSILAGFLEAGESAEHAVVREVREESGLAVDAVRFLSTQPWPYPRSLMLAFVARAHGEVRVDGQEIAWARWYAPGDLGAAIDEGLTLPGSGSIAGRVIQQWRDGALPLPPRG